MSTLISLRLGDDQTERLEQLTHQTGRSVSDVAAQVLDEGLRTRAHPAIEFRDSPVGRQAYVSATSLAVWEVVMVARAYVEVERVEQTAQHLRWPATRVLAALRYAAEFAGEIQAALDDNDSYDFARLQRELPGVRRFVVPDAGDLAVS